MATTVLGLKTFAASDPVDYNEVNDNYTKIDNGVKTALQGRAAHNLLDNSDFTNPVNQRGKTSYTSGNEYTIDRWRITYDTILSIQNGYINLSGKWNVLQILKNPKNGVYTFAAKIRINSKGDNNPYMALSETAKYLDAPIGQWKTYVSTCDLSAVSDDTVNFLIDISGNTTDGSLDVEWAAIYEGSYTADTLPAYQPKGYSAELVECQRYYNVINPSEYLYQNSYAGGYTVYSLIIQFPKMRIVPTIKVDGTIEGYNHQTDSTLRVYSTQPNSIVNSVTLSADL